MRRNTSRYENQQEATRSFSTWPTPYDQRTRLDRGTERGEGEGKEEDEGEAEGEGERDEEEEGGRCSLEGLERAGEPCDERWPSLMGMDTG